MAATLDRLSDRRALINVVTGGDPVENVDDGGPPGHAERYQLTSEFLTVYRRLLAGETVDFTGRHFQVDGAQLPFAPVQEGGPPLWFGGSSAEASKIAAATIDRYLTWGDPPAQVAEKIAAVRALAAARGRRISFGIRLHVIVRRTVAAAWAAADELIEHFSDATIAHAEQVGKRDRLEVNPNPWPRRGPRARGRRHRPGGRPRNRGPTHA